MAVLGADEHLDRDVGQNVHHYVYGQDERMQQTPLEHRREYARVSQQLNPSLPC